MTNQKVVPIIEEDRVFYHDIQAIIALIENNKIIPEVEKIIGELK